MTTSILLTPARIGAVEIPNRIVMPPMTTRTADDEGHVTEDTLAYYLARAAGGAGLITVEMASPERAGRHRRREIGIHDDRFLPGLTRLVDTIHAAGSRVIPSIERVVAKSCPLNQISTGILMRARAPVPRDRQWAPDT